VSGGAPTGAGAHGIAAARTGSRWGVFGGSFDPPHLGHQRAAFEAMEALDLTGVLWVPTPQNPLKPAAAAGAADRRDLVAAAIDDEPRFELSTLELDGPAPAYTADTLACLRAAHPERDWTLILGADAWAGFARWQRPPAVLAQADVAVVVRPDASRPAPEIVLQDLDANGSFCYDQDQDDDAWTIRFLLDAEPRTVRVRFLNSTALAISSTALRDLIAAGRRPKYLLSDRVYKLIEDRELYGFRRR